MRGIWKSTFREIKSSFGRFMAIFAIVALGVGFFAGLTVTRESMANTVEQYLAKYDFYDFRLLSTLGFEEQDVEYLAGMGAEAVEGGVSADVMYVNQDGSQPVIKIYSLPGQVNTLKLISGRMPESANECVVDSNLFGDTAISSKLTLSADNKEDTLKQFAYGEYTIVGRVQSPLYIQFERGNTSIGTGQIAGFAYVPYEGFDVEYYTEIYVKFAEDFPLYSEEYKAFIEEKQLAWEEYTVHAAGRRYADIVEEANAELADAEAEFQEKKAEGEAELADAEATLNDAEEKLAEGEVLLADAKKELADGEETLREKEAELADAKKTLAEKEAELTDAEKKLAEGRDEWNRNNEEVEDAKAEINTAREELAAEAQKLNEQKQTLLALAAAGLISDAELQAGLMAIAEGEAAIEEYGYQLDDSMHLLLQADTELAEAMKQIEESEAELAEGRQTIADAKQELIDGEQAIVDAKADIEDAKETLAKEEADFADAKAEYAEGEAEYRDALNEFEEKIAEAEAELWDAKQEIQEIEKPETYVLGRDTNVGYVCFDNDAAIIAGIANIFPVFFLLVAVLVCVTTMNRMVEEQRTQIGVLKALGYSEIAIMSKYMVYSGVAALSGCVVGFFLGTWGFPEVIWYVYGIMYQADPLSYVFNWKLAVISLVVSMICSMGTTWLSCRNELIQVAATLMRPKTPKAGKRIFLEYIPFVWKRFSFLQKVSVRNIFRYKKRLFMMVVGISGCTALLVAGFGIKDSVTGIAGVQFSQIQTYDVSVSFTEEVSEEVKEDIAGLYREGIAECTYVMEKNMDLVTEAGTKTLILVAGEPEQMPGFVVFRDENEKLLPYPEFGCAVISDRIAEDYDVKVGDIITLRDEDMNSVEVEVSHIYKNHMSNYVHMSVQTWQQLSGEKAQVKAAYLNLQEGADAHKLAAKLMQLETVVNVTVNADMMDRVDSMLGSLNIIVVVVILCAAGLAFIVLYNLTNINITERIREIATVKVLGFYKKETASYVFRENILLTVLGMLVGLVLGKLLHYVIMDMVRVDMVSFDAYVRPISYFYSGVLTIAFTWFVNKVMGRKLEKISMTESLKSVD